MVTPSALLDQLLTGIVILDNELTVRYVNSAAESLLDHSAKRLMGAPFSAAFLHSSLAPETLLHCLQNEQTLFNAETQIALHSGNSVRAEVSIQAIEYDTARGLLLELKHVDQWHRINQEDQQRNQLYATQHLLRGMAHEIKNPLGGLRGAAQLLARQLPSPQLTEYTDLIISQSDRLRDLVDRLLGPNQRHQPKDTNIHEVLEAVITTLTYEYGDTLVFQRDYDPSLPDMRVVAEACEQVFLNIAQNAAQAVSGTGTIEVKTRVEHQVTLFGSRYRQCAVITFGDNGPGVPDSIQDTLFYPLISGRAEGTGLGLSLAQSLVHQHQGKIAFESRPGKTEFSVYLPYLADDNDDEVRHAH